MNEASFTAEPQENNAVRNVRRPQLESVHDLRIRHRLLYRNLGISALDLPEYAHLGQIPVPIHVSRIPLRALKRITLQDLRMDEIARGEYLALRTLESAFTIISIVTVVEDHEGNAIEFCMSNYDSPFITNLDDIFPVGTVFILKEPFCNMSPAKTVLIRCDCPSNVIVVYEGHPMFVLTCGITWINDIGLEDVPKPTFPREWKARGDELSNRRKFVQASRCYLIALQKLGRLKTANDNLLQRSLQLSLTAVYLFQGFFEKALELAGRILEDNPRSRQALCDAGQSYYSLRHYDKAVPTFGKCNAYYPADVSVRARLKQAKERLFEQETGEFSMKMTDVRANFKSQEDNECADFVGPVKIVSVPGQGFGIISTKDLEPGSLLVVSKALGYSRDPENVVDGKVSKNVCGLVRLAHISQLVLKNPMTFGTMVYNLFDGKQFHNSEPVQLFCDAETKLEPIVDVEKIRNILEHNYFDQSSGNDERNSNDRFEMLDKLRISDRIQSGLFIFPSYFNHSCRPNAVCQIFNDVMFVRAIQFIKANEEVSVSYFSWELEYPDRMLLCQKRGFLCFCQLCIEDRETSTSVQSKRENIVLQFKNIAASIFAESPACSPHDLSNLCQLIRELDATFQRSESLRAVTASNHLYSLLAKAYSMDKHYDSFKEIKEIECHFNTLRLFGFDPVAMEQGTVGNGTHWITPNAFLDPQVIFAVSKLIFVFNSISGIESCCKWVEILFALEWMYSGGDKYHTHFKYEKLQRLFVPYWRKVGF